METPIRNCRRRRYWFAAVMAFAVIVPCELPAQVDYLEPPIDYLNAEPNDAVSRLQKKLADGECTLEFDDEYGYLKSVLQLLDVPESSQGLVFSKTSFQLRRISPQTPRAIYFGDDVYIGWVQGGDVIEVSTVDPQLGANYYVLNQQPGAPPEFERMTHACLQCHASSLTRNIPGHIVRSVYPRPDGHPLLTAGTHRTDHTSPIGERWGGWYVTGQHGSQRHLGNLLVRESDDPDKLNLDAGANVTDLEAWIETSRYLTPHSDIVALMVLEHQTKAHNLLTRANFSAQYTLRDARVINGMLGRPEDHESDSTQRRLDRAAEPVVEYLLFAEEAPLTAPIAGTSDFTKEFAARGPFDKRGRSLRQFDLQTRLFRYPCSYVIYSAAFDELPRAVQDRIYRRMWEVLTGRDKSEKYAHLSSADRAAILEILRETKPHLPKYWRDSAAAAQTGNEEPAAPTETAPATAP